MKTDQLASEEYDVEGKSREAMQRAFEAMDGFEHQRRLAVELEQKEPDEEFVTTLENVLLAFRDPALGDIRAHWFLLSLVERLGAHLADRHQLTGDLHDAFRLSGWLTALWDEMLVARRLIENPPQARTVQLPTREELIDCSDAQICRIYGWYDERSGKVDVLKAREFKAGRVEAPTETILPASNPMIPTIRPKLLKLIAICNAITQSRQG